MEFGGQGTVTCQEPESSSDISRSNLEVTNMVPNPSGDGNMDTPLSPEFSKPDHADSQSQQARHHTTISRMGYLRNQFRSQKLSEEASKLLFASW